MRRREFFEKAGLGSAALVSLPALGHASKAQTGVAGAQEHEHHGRHAEMDGPGSSAEVSFGQWDLDTPLDRFPNNSPRLRNFHKLIPGTVDIRAGGSVNFIIAGFHHVLIYDDGHKPTDIDLTKTIAPTAGGPPLIDDPHRRIYRGLDPSVMPLLPGSMPPQPLQDRVETVRFTRRGKYLVMCGVLPHFFEAGEFVMFGYVRVRR
jgi:hypothetical protein